MTVSSVQPSLFDRFNALPRAMRWLVLAVVCTLGFLAWDETVHPLAMNWNAEAEKVEAKVAQLRAGEELEAQYRRLTSLVESIGPVEVPTDEESGRNALSAAVNAVLATHSVSKQSFESRASGRLPKGALAGISGLKGKRIDRLTGDLQFEASPKDAVAVLAALEARPEIDAVNAVRITKEANQKLKVRLTLEAWVVSKDADKA